jgi:hypothetical protein
VVGESESREQVRNVHVQAKLSAFSFQVQAIYSTWLSAVLAVIGQLGWEGKVMYVVERVSWMLIS